MVTAHTEGISISVEVFYQYDYSIPSKFQYVFAYRISIVNDSPHTIQLTRRQWFIYETNGRPKEVEGPGVVGQTPILKPQEKYQYVSACHLKSDMGFMYGNYLMVRQSDQYEFRAKIPRFELIAPFKNN